MPTDPLPEMRAARAAAENARLCVRPLLVALVIYGVLLLQLGYVLLRRPAEGRGLDAWLLLIGVLLNLVLWVRWFRGVYRGVSALGLARFPMALATIGWLVPIVNLVVPKQMVNDLWPRRGTRPLVVDLWWLCWVAPVVLRMVGRGAGGYAHGPVFTAVVVAALVAVTPLALFTVQAVTARLEELVAAVAPAPAAAAS